MMNIVELHIGHVLWCPTVSFLSIDIDNEDGVKKDIIY